MQTTVSHHRLHRVSYLGMDLSMSRRKELILQMESVSRVYPFYIGFLLIWQGVTNGFKGLGCLELLTKDYSLRSKEGPIEFYISPHFLNMGARLVLVDTSWDQLGEIGRPCQALFEKVGFWKAP